MRRRRDDRHADVRAWPAVLATTLTVGVLAGGFAITDAGPTSFAAATVATLATLGVSAAAIHFFVTSRYRARERAAQRRVANLRNDSHDEKRERLALRELDRGLDMAPSESEALAVIRSTFERHLADQPMELHLVDPLEPVLVLAVATGNHDTRPGERTSPWDSLAASSGRTLVYETTDRPDACNHLRRRTGVARSAVAVPVTAAGGLLGVLYGFGLENEQPGPGDVEFLEDLAAVVGARLAILRTGGPSTSREAVDRLTGLPDRATMQSRVLNLLKERTPFAVAVADIDDFGAINESLGRDAGDRALELLAKVARRSIRPDDILGRIGGDELLFVLPRSLPDDATRAIERLREELVLAQAEPGHPGFTLSVGVVGSTAGDSIDEILHRAAEALQHAKGQGGNRVVVARPVRRTA